MSNKLPVPLRNQSRNQLPVVPGQPNAASSAVARLAVSLAPDVLRAAERIILRRSGPQPAGRQQTQGMHGHSVSMSEVEIDTSLPFVRRVTVRNASSWSTFPIIAPEPTHRGMSARGRLIGISGAIIVLVAVMARKVIPTGRVIDVQGRQRD